jgi:hypothetical protein
MRLALRPADLNLKWSDEDRRIFVGANGAWELWHAWLQTHEPTDDQIYRKLLLDLFFDYRNARHLGGDFDSIGPEYEEFNRSTGEPIRSMEDYVERILVLLDYQTDNRLSSAEDLALAKFAFIVTGDPGRPPP